jgi:[NiFe] hydrogenase diaphorase moiety large subunit
MVTCKSLLNQYLEQFGSRKVLGENVLGLEGFYFDVDLFVSMGDYFGRDPGALTAFLNGFRPEYEAVLPPTAQSYLIRPVDHYLKAAAIAAESFLPIEDLDAQVAQRPVIISVCSNCAQPGIYQVHESTTIAEVLERVGAQGTFAVQVGGFSSSLTQPQDFGHPVDLDALRQTGSFIIYGPGTDLVEVARDNLRYFHEASCDIVHPAAAVFWN